MKAEQDPEVVILPDFWLVLKKKYTVPLYKHWQKEVLGTQGTHI